MERNGKADQAGLADLLYRSFIESLACYLFGRFDEPLACEGSRAKDGNQRWELADGATLYDVTHLGCRSARYTPATANNACSPANVRTKGFPVNPGAAMPVVNGCRKQDYAVLIVVGLPVTH